MKTFKKFVLISTILVIALGSTFSSAFAYTNYWNSTGSNPYGNAGNHDQFWATTYSSAGDGIALGYFHITEMNAAGTITVDSQKTYASHMRSDRMLVETTTTTNAVVCLVLDALYKTDKGNYVIAYTNDTTTSVTKVTPHAVYPYGNDGEMACFWGGFVANLDYSFWLQVAPSE